MATVSIMKASYSDIEIETLLAPLGGMAQFVKKKIMYGAVPGLTKAKYHAQFPRKVSFADMILDILTIVKPQLYIMDGILGMQGQGPGNGDPIKMDLVLASTDHVALDIAVCKILGIESVGIPALKMAKIRGLWPELIDYPIHRPEDVAVKGFRLPNTADHLLTGKKLPRKSPVITDNCTACGECESICPKDAVKVKGRMAEITYFVAESLVLPPGCRPCPTGRKLGQVRDDRLCHLSNLLMVFRRRRIRFQVSGKNESRVLNTD
jgi:NAD-dependent dihydropyrimidine dehydrogenase PreA subunit